MHWYSALKCNTALGALAYYRPVVKNMTCKIVNINLRVFCLRGGKIASDRFLTIPGKVVTGGPIDTHRKKS